MSLSVLGIGTVSALGSGVLTLRDGLKGRIKPNIEEKVIPTTAGDAVSAMEENALPILRRESMLSGSAASEIWVQNSNVQIIGIARAKKRFLFLVL